MQIEHSANVLPLEVETQDERLQPTVGSSKSRFFALGSAALLIAGIVAFQSDAFAPEKAATATSLIAQDDLIYAPEVSVLPSGQVAEYEVGEGKVRADLAQLTCDVLPLALASTLEEAEAALHLRCLGGRCDLGNDMPQSQVDALNNAADNILEHTRAADAKHCLVETMSDNVVEEGARSVGRLFDEVLEGASAAPTVTWNGEPSISVKERLRRSFADIDKWSQSLLVNSDSILDRRRVFARNVGDPHVCPEPCIRCTMAHNSLFEGDEQFSFKCILPRTGIAPSFPDLSCSEPVRRTGIAGQLHGQTKTWCDVRSWHAVHEQAINLAADVKCGSAAIFGPLRHGIEMEERVREACQSVERGQPTEALAVQMYDEYTTILDDVATPGEDAAFRIFMELGMAQGLAGLRRATRGNMGPRVVGESNI